MTAARGGAYRWLLSAAAACAIAVLVARYEGVRLDAAGDVRLWFRCWSDGAFVAAVFLAGGGAMLAVAQGGGFDMLAYSLGMLARAFRRPAADGTAAPSYYDYVRHRREKPRAPLLHLVAPGVAMVCVSLALAGLA